LVLCVTRQPYRRTSSGGRLGNYSDSLSGYRSQTTVAPIRPMAWSLHTIRSRDGIVWCAASLLWQRPAETNNEHRAGAKDG